MKLFVLLIGFLCTACGMNFSNAANSPIQDRIVKLRERVSQEIPYQSGTVKEIAIDSDQKGVLLKCGDNSEDVKEILIGADSKILFIYCILSSGLVKGGGSELKRAGSFRQVGGSAAIGMWEVENGKITLNFQLTDDDHAIVQSYRKLKKAGRFSTAINDWGTLLDDPELLFPRLTAEQRIEGFTRLWCTVKYNFANFDLVPELNWDNILSEYLPKVLRDQSNSDFIRLLQECVARLNDGHTSVTAEWGSGRPAACPPLGISSIGGKAVITEAGKTEEIKTSGIKAGDEITHIDGCPVQDVLREKIYPYLFASTSQWRDLEAYPQLLTGPRESKISLTIKTQEGTVRKVSLTRKAGGLALLPKRAAGHELVEYRDLGNGIAYVSLNGFGSDEVVQRFIGKAKQINEAKGLILDVRENGGGNSRYGDEIISCLIDKPIPDTCWKTPQYRAAFRAWGRDEPWYIGEKRMIKPGIANRFPGPVVILIGPKTFSAGEDFVVPLKAAGRATVVGQRSGGSTGQPLEFRFLEGKIFGRVCAKRDQYPDGRDFVGTGIIPDVEVSPTLKDVCDGRDIILEKGVEVIKEKIARGSGTR